MIKKNAFTLAEVLITLAIIGVVAAMTIPTLMTNVGAQKYKTGFKRSYATMKQAVIANEATNGYNFASLASYKIVGDDGNYVKKKDSSGNDTTTDDTNTARTFATFVTGSFDSPVAYNSSYLTKTTGVLDQSLDIGAPTVCTAANVVDTITAADGTTKTNTSPCKGKAVGSMVDTATSGSFKITAADYTTYKLADGTVIGFNNKANKCKDEKTAITNNCVGFLDVNGIQGPNVVMARDAATNAQLTDIIPIIYFGTTIKPGHANAQKILDDQITQ